MNPLLLLASIMEHIHEKSLSCKNDIQSTSIQEINACISSDASLSLRITVGVDTKHKHLLCRWITYLAYIGCTSESVSVSVKSDGIQLSQAILRITSFSVFRQLSFSLRHPVVSLPTLSLKEKTELSRANKQLKDYVKAALPGMLTLQRLTRISYISWYFFFSLEQKQNDLALRGFTPVYLALIAGAGSPKLSNAVTLRTPNLFRQELYKCGCRQWEFCGARIQQVSDQHVKVF